MGDGTPELVPRYDGPLVATRRSLGGRVRYLERWEDNVLPPPAGRPWPAYLLRQVCGYTARASWFASRDAEALAAHLGRISKFQSLHSEDAVTWSWFGTLALAEPRPRRRAVQWLYDRIGLDVKASPAPIIDLWRRVTHPNRPGSRRGPELDARIDDPGAALVYVEAKWKAALGRGKGSIEGQLDDQIVLRRDSLRVDASLADDPREFVVLAVTNEPLDLSPYAERSGEPFRSVTLAWLGWDDLVECDAHPLAEDFRRYLDWKREHAGDGAGFS